MSVITRFAPSPTGFLHIGGARTALFNYLFARHHGGTYMLRVEDTDRARSTDEAIAAIYDGLNWLDLAGDQDPVYQFSRMERHTDIAHQLLEKGLAYRCYLTPEELSQMREEARKIGYPIRSPWREKTAAEAPDAPYVVRLKMPESGSNTIPDAVQGEVTVQHQQLDDLVMLRSDGTPTYMLAVVVDDHDMGVTHIIRGDDHLNNAFRQQKIIAAMDWPQPVYAHIPLIHGADGAKLSKRHGALSVTAYRDMGFLPEAVNNYLLRLGWSHGDDEMISRDQAIEWFDLGGIGKSPARFDSDKLTALNSQYIAQMPDEDVIRLIAPEPLSDDVETRLRQLVPALKERANLITDLSEMAHFALISSPPAIDDDAKPLLDADMLERLQRLARDYPEGLNHLDQVKTWFSDWLTKQGLKMRDVGPGLRVALTGKRQAPDIALLLTILGQKQIVIRLDNVCNKSI
ncbi:MAG: glutamate--tRNA ligase [Candidatus Puniceispirillales bacterium]